MTDKKYIQKAVCLLTAIFIAVFCSVSVFAVDDMPSSDVSEIVDEQPELPNEYVEPVTEPVTEPETIYEEPTYVEPATEPQTEYVASEATEYVEEQTEQTPTQEVQEQTEYYAQNVTESVDKTEFVAPTVAKTVSTKSYTTNYTAGIVSWICVAIGVIVVAAVLISNKVGGKGRV